MRPGVTALVCVVNGDAYVRYAEELFESANEFFRPTERVVCTWIEGHPGWPDATMYRPDVLAARMPEAHYVFLCDADMLFAGHVGEEILPPSLFRGLTATLHPGYVGKSRAELPFETREDSFCYVAPDEGDAYYCGGFYGGAWATMLEHCQRIGSLIQNDTAAGVTPVWHDESAHNRVLASFPPAVTLSPAYCYPDDDAYYREQVWNETYEPKLVARVKTQEERGER